MKWLATRAAGIAIAAGVLASGHDAHAVTYPKFVAEPGPTGSGEIIVFGCGFTPGGVVYFSASNQVSEYQGGFYTVATSSGPYIGCASGEIQNLGCGYVATVDALDLTTDTPAIPSQEVNLHCIQ